MKYLVNADNEIEEYTDFNELLEEVYAFFDGEFIEETEEIYINGKITENFDKDFKINCEKFKKVTINNSELTVVVKIC